MARFCALVLACLAAWSPALLAAEPPPVVLITLDTVRADHLRSYGNRNIETPNLDALAAAGVQFDQAYSPVPITLPSHSIMLTGTLPMLNGMHDFSGNTLSPQQPTLATLLRARGYATGAVLGSAVLDRRFGLNSGFDFYYDNFDFSRLNETNLDAMERPASEVVDRALEWLGQRDAKPFLLWVHLYDPHHPYAPPAPFNERYKDDPYAGEIAYVDAQLGRVLQHLRERKLFDSALIIVAGDHGEALGEHGEETHGFFIYNSTLHVPLIIKPPAGASGWKKKVDAHVSLADLLPTVLDLVQAPAPAKLHGSSLLPVMRGTERPKAELYAESYLPRIHFNWSELRALQSDRYRFIEAPKPELYDIVADPGETKNLFASKPAVAAVLRARLREFIKEHSADAELAEKSSLDPALMQRLQALGYLATGARPTDLSISDPKLADPKDRIHIYQLVSHAIRDSQEGRYPDAIAKLEKAVAEEGDSVPIRYLLGLSYYRAREYARAVPHLERVLQLSPDYALAAYNLGLAYGRSGNLPASVKWLRRALELDSTNFLAAFNLGAALAQSGDLAGSIAYFQQAVQINPEYAEAQRTLGEVLLHQGRPQEAVTHLRAAVQLRPDDARARAALARAEAATQP